MKRSKIIVIAAIAVLGVAALGGAAVRANAADTSPAPDTTTAITTAVATPETPSTTDTDNVQLQEGDQNGPDGTEASDKAEAGSTKAEADGPGGPNDQSGNQVEDGQPDTGPADVE